MKAELRAFVRVQALLSNAWLLHDARLERLEGVLPLAAPDELPHARHQHIHGRHRLAIFIQLHIEGLDVLGVVVHDGGLLEHCLAEIPAPTLALGPRCHATCMVDVCESQNTAHCDQSEAV